MFVTGSLFGVWERLWLLPLLLVAFVLAGAYGYSEAGKFVSGPVDASAT